MARADEVLALLQATGEPMSRASIAAALGVSVSTAWNATMDLLEATPRRIRVGGWLTGRGTRTPMYDTRVNLPDAPKPEALPKAEHDRVYMQNLRADPVRLAALHKRLNDAAKARRAARKKPKPRAADLVRQAIERYTVPATARMIAARAGVSLTSADNAIRVMLADHQIRVAAWGETLGNGSRPPMYDTRVDLPDAPYPKTKGDRRNDAKPIRRTDPKAVPVHAAAAG